MQPINPLSVINCIILGIGAGAVLLAACLIMLIFLLVSLNRQRILIQQIHGVATVVPKVNTNLDDTNH